MTTFSNNPFDAVIVHVCRTPLLRAKKNSDEAPALSTLLSTVLVECVKNIDPETVEDICVGNVLSPPSNVACFRMAAISSGIPSSVPLSTINRQCASGLEAINIIANSIISGQIKVGIAAGAESMSHHKMSTIPPPDVDWDVMERSKEAMDCLTPMGITSENVTKDFKISRESMDKTAYSSHRKAYNATEKFIKEIVPVSNTPLKDTGVRQNVSLETLSQLKPVFEKKGCTTAGNSSQMTDGAAAVLLMSRHEAMRRQIPILAIWRGCKVVGVPPRIMGVGPKFAIPALLSDFGLTTEDIDLFEINEAFASQFNYCMKELKLNPEKVNPNGGAIALGHPLGCTGARLTVSIIHELRRRRKSLGVVSMCIGTGMGAAALLEVPQGSKL